MAGSGWLAVFRILGYAQTRSYLTLANGTSPC